MEISNVFLNFALTLILSICDTVGSFVPDNAKATSEEFEREEVSDEIEEIFDEDTEFANDDEALAAMEFYDTSDDTE